MFLVCSTNGLPVRKIFKGYEEKRFELTQLLLQKCHVVCYFSPHTNSLFSRCVTMPPTNVSRTIMLSVSLRKFTLNHHNWFSNFEFQNTKHIILQGSYGKGKKQAIPQSTRVISYHSLAEYSRGSLSNYVNTFLKKPGKHRSFIKLKIMQDEN